MNHFSALMNQAGVQDLSNFAVKTFDMSFRSGGWRVNWDGESNCISPRILYGR